VDSTGVSDARIQEAHVVGPELMVLAPRRLAQALDESAYGQRVRVRRVRHDPNAAVLGQRARRPAARGIATEPLARTPVQRVVRIEQGDQDVDVEHLMPLHQRHMRQRRPAVDE
jgi:hypothetical protein